MQPTLSMFTLYQQHVEVCMFLREEQGMLIEQLRRRSPEIADMYYGGLCSFADDKNPYIVYELERMESRWQAVVTGNAKDALAKPKTPNETG